MSDIDFTSMSLDEVETFGRGKGIHFEGSLEKDEMIKQIEDAIESEESMSADEFAAHTEAVEAAENELVGSE